MIDWKVMGDGAVGEGASPVWTGLNQACMIKGTCYTYYRIYIHVIIYMLYMKSINEVGGSWSKRCQFQPVWCPLTVVFVKAPC